MADPGTVLLAAMGAFFVLMVVVSYVNQNGLRGMVPARRKEYESVSEFADRRSDDEE